MRRTKTAARFACSCPVCMQPRGRRAADAWQTTFRAAGKTPQSCRFFDVSDFLEGCFRFVLSLFSYSLGVSRAFVQVRGTLPALAYIMLYGDKSETSKNLQEASEFPAGAAPWSRERRRRAAGGRSPAGRAAEPGTPREQQPGAGSVRASPSPTSSRLARRLVVLRTVADHHSAFVITYTLQSRIDQILVS